MRTAFLFRRGALSVIALMACALLEPADLHAQYFRFGKNKVQYEARNWRYIQSKHFDVYYYEGGEALARFTAKAAEEAYVQVADLFQHQISDRIPIIAYKSHNDFAVTNAVDLPTFSEGIGGVTELYKNRIAIPFTGDYRDYRRVVHHELVHAVINDMFYGGSIQSILQNNLRLQIPTWFNEGLAEYAALGWDTESDMYVREAVLEDDLAPISRLRGYFAYRGGQSVWDYVAEQYGQEKIAEILQRLRASRSVERSFKQATGLALDELSERWHDRLKEVYFPEIAAREDLNETATPLITGEEHGGRYNTSPALSPQGDKLAYITTKSGLFDVYLADAGTGETIRKLVDGQTSVAFESLRILSPGITWSPDGRKIALAVKSGPSEAIAVVNVKTGNSKHYRVPDVDQILSVSWSPEGRRIAFSASRNAQSDLYVLNLKTKQTTNYTRDLFSDLDPAWSPDGQALVFHSDRGGYTRLGQHQADRFDMIGHDYHQYDVYYLSLGAAQVRRLTATPTWDEKQARFGRNPNKVLFVSDRNGIFNLYAKNLETGTERPLTDAVVGVMQVSLSADGRKAALMTLHEGTPSIYMMKAPFQQMLDREEPTLQPNVWAQRVMQESAAPSPAVALASPILLQNNPFLRDASDGVSYQRSRQPAGLLASRADVSSDAQDGVPAEAADGEATAEDSTAYGSTRVDFRNYIFGEGFDRAQAEKQAEDPGLEADRFDPEDNVDEDGNYKPKPYKLKFSADLITGATSYDVLYGVQGATQMRFSDMLGNHQILVSSNLRIDLRNSNYYLSYSYLPRRTDWELFGYHTSILLRDATTCSSFVGAGMDACRYYRYRRYGAGLSASYPFDKFRRIDVDLSGMGVSQTNIVDPSEETQTRFLLYPALTFTKDVTTPGLLAPRNGHRVALSLAGSPGHLVGGNQLRFMTLLGDARAYTSFGSGFYTLAVRLSGGTSFGPDPQLFYSSGVQNWIFRRFDQDNGLPIGNVSDLMFATPVLPLRGYAINAQNGSHFGLLNAEFRMPLVAALLPGPLPILPLYNIQSSAFLDAGTLWGGRNTENTRFNVFRQNEQGERVLDDLLVGAGVGLRTIVFGFPMRLDFAWPFDGRRFGQRHTYFSIGLDF